MRPRSWIGLASLAVLVGALVVLVLRTPDQFIEDRPRDCC